MAFVIAERGISSWALEDRSKVKNRAEECLTTTDRNAAVTSLGLGCSGQVDSGSSLGLAKRKHYAGIPRAMYSVGSWEITPFKTPEDVIWLPQYTPSSPKTT
jgi:hypothetical protein